MPPNLHLIDRLQTLSRLAAVIVIVIGSLVTLGWVFNIALLKTLLTDMTPMKPNTALCFIASGFVLLRHRTGPSRLILICGGFVTAIGLLTLIEYALNWNLGIDQWLVYEASTAQTLYPGRMSPMSAVNFCLIGSSLLFITRSHFLALAQSLVGIAALVALLSLTGYLYAVQSLYQFGVLTPIALPTAVTFFILCFAIFFTYPEKGLAALVVTKYAGGRMARRALPAALVMPLLLGWMWWKGQQAGLYDPQVEHALFALSNIVVFTLLIFWTAGSLNRADAVIVAQQEQRDQAAAELRQSHEQLENQVQERTHELVEMNQALEERVIQRKRAEDQFRALLESAPDAVIIVTSHGEIILVNAQTEKFFGYLRSELLGKSIEMLIPENFHSRHTSHRSQYIAQPHVRSMGAGLELYALRKDGSQFPVEISLSPIETEDGVVIASSIRDITERQQVEVVLRENEEKLQTIFKVLPVGVTLMNPDRQIIQINPALEKILDLSPDDLMRGSYKTRKYIHSDSTPMQPNEFPSEQAFHEQQAVLDVEIGVIKEDGTTVWTSVSAAPLPGHQGVVTVTVDITERKQAEQSVARLAEIVESSDDAIISKTLDGMITSWNAGAERIFAYTPEEMIGKPITILLPPDRMNEEDEILEQVRQGEHINGFETIRLNKHGQPIAVSLTISPMRNTHGRIIGASKIARDITERKQAEETLRESERQFRLLTQNSPDVIYVLDLINQRATYLNRTEFLGYSQSELETSGALLSALYPEDKAAVMAHWREITTGNQFQAVGMIEYRLQDKQGQWQWVQSRETIFASASDGTPTQILVTLSVITGRKQAEQQAIELEKKQQRVRILSDFIRDTSHDFRTPLTIINTSLYLLSKVTDTDKQAEYLARVYQQTMRLTQMINQSLTMVRLDSEGVFEFQHLDMNAMISNFCAQVRVEAKEKGITVLSTFWDSPLFIQADSTELGLALVELGRNAVLYTPPKGVITIRVWQQENQAVIDVADTGIGIPEADVPYIFQPLYRVDKARSLETGGGGLGLSIAKRIIELHQGHIVVESVVGEGSLFRVFLPLSE